jgi:biopolymer transport protein TolR
MSRKVPLSSLKQINEINLTPLMDLTFILLITFIITFPLIEQGISVNLPKGDADEVAVEDARTITIDKMGLLYFDDFEISHDDLMLRMAEVGKQVPAVTVMVRADESINYGSVVRVLKVLHDSNIQKMALVTASEE